MEYSSGLGRQRSLEFAGKYFEGKTNADCLKRAERFFKQIVKEHEEGTDIIRGGRGVIAVITGSGYWFDDPARPGVRAGYCQCGDGTLESVRRMAARHLADYSWDGETLDVPAYVTNVDDRYEVLVRYMENMQYKYGPIVNLIYDAEGDGVVQIDSDRAYRVWLAQLDIPVGLTGNAKACPIFNLLTYDQKTECKVGANGIRRGEVEYAFTTLWTALNRAITQCKGDGENKRVTGRDVLTAVRSVTMWQRGAKEGTRWAVEAAAMREEVTA